MQSSFLKVPQLALAWYGNREGIRRTVKTNISSPTSLLHAAMFLMYTLLDSNLLLFYCTAMVLRIGQPLLKRATLNSNHDLFHDIHCHTP